MSTHAVVAFGTMNDWTGVYVHFDGYQLREPLQAIIDRDGVDRARQVILSETMWRFIEPANADERANHNTKRVAGYGHAYTDSDAPAVCSCDGFLSVGATHLYVINDEGEIAHVH